MYRWFAELQLFQGKNQQGKSEKTLRAYHSRLGFFLDFTVQNSLRYLDQIDRKQLLGYVKFLREHDSDPDDRTVHNIFETLNTFLRTRDILIAGKILAELEYARNRRSHIQSRNSRDYLRSCAKKWHDSMRRNGPHKSSDFPCPCAFQTSQ